MNIIEHNLDKIDKFQRTHRTLAFPYAVIKKYGEDHGGYQAVLLTYYAFLSLFPLLLVVTTVAHVLLRSDSPLNQRIISGITNYFPIIGNQLQHDVHGFSGTGLPAILGLLFLFYGARGVADAFRHAANNIWHVPMRQRSGYLPARARSASMVAGGGLGFIASAVIASYATLAGHSLLLRLPFILASAAVLFYTFLFLIKMALNRPVHLHDIRAGAAVATVGLLIMQGLGGYIVTHELKHLDSLYGTFAVVLGLFFWLYLQAQLIIYAMEIDTVRVLKLWPRRLIGDDHPRTDEI